MARISAAVLAFVLMLSWGCSTWPVHPGPEILKTLQGKRVGVVLLAVPAGSITEVATNTRIVGPATIQGWVDGPWRDDLEYEPIRLAQMRPLQQEVVEGRAGEFTIVQDMFVEGMKRRGVESFKVGQPVAARGLPLFDGGILKRLYPAYDYRYLGQAHGADFLVVIDLKSYGPYCHFIYATNDYMEVRAQASVQLIDVSTNRILWQTARGRGSFRAPVEASCGKEEEVPVIIRELDNLLKQTSDAMYLDFFIPGT
jgi:hypothetical protein